VSNEEDDEEPPFWLFDPNDETAFRLGKRVIALAICGVLGGGVYWVGIPLRWPIVGFVLLGVMGGGLSFLGGYLAGRSQEDGAGVVPATGRLLLRLAWVLWYVVVAADVLRHLLSR
jgi:hypothetical protein